MPSRIQEEPIDDRALLAEIAAPANGALLLFHGVVRNHHEGKAVDRIDYHAYRPMADRILEELTAEIAAEFGLDHLVVVHRIGVLAVGEASLLVAAGSAHRPPVFEAVLALVDRLKARVPIWKKEYGPDGTSWVEGVLPEMPEGDGA